MLRYYKQKHHFINFFCKYSHLFAFGFKKFATALHFFMPLALSATTSLLQNVSICPNMSQNVSKCLKINSIFLKTHFETFWDILSNFEQFWADFWGRYETFWDILSWFWAILSNFEQFWAILSDFERNLFGQQFVYLNSPFNLHVIPAQLEFTNYGDWS